MGTGKEERTFWPPQDSNFCSRAEQAASVAAVISSSGAASFSLGIIGASLVAELSDKGGPRIDVLRSNGYYGNFWLETRTKKEGGEKALTRYNQ